ncbi:MAG: hypothetical protein LBE39_02105 [Flavobacteriaceae bacterium]|jgi:hypothetical protein|nr:hypothetical protein [Flavobacteriaceae bacterium]
MQPLGLHFYINNRYQIQILGDPEKILLFGDSIPPEYLLSYTPIFTQIRLLRSFILIPAIPLSHMENIVHHNEWGAPSGDLSL